MVALKHNFCCFLESVSRVFFFFVGVHCCKPVECNCSGKNPLFYRPTRYSLTVAAQCSVVTNCMFCLEN